MKKSAKILLSLFLCFVMASSGLAVSFAQNSMSSKVISEDYRVVSDGGINKVVMISDEETYYDGPIIQTNSNFPSSYDSRTKNIITSVKDQGYTGTCWAFASLNAIETSYILNGYGNKNNTNFSENHLVWFTYKKSPDLLDGPVDVGSVTSEFKNPYLCGGTWEDAANTLTNWWGVELDSNAPLYPYNYSMNGNLSESKRTVSYARLEDAFEIADTQYDSIERMDEIKYFITEYGTLYLSMNFDISNFNGYSYYQDDYVDSDHAVSVVGWDDNYSKNNFKSNNGTRPSNNGAWLIKNSHGTDSGNNGYFWLSYYDKSIQDFAFFSVSSNDNYDNVYTYNGAAPSRYYTFKEPTLKYANTFVAEKNETVESVGLWLFDDVTKINIKVYTDTTSHPESGNLEFDATVEDDSFYTGFHTFMFSKSIPIAKNSKYSVVVEIENDGGNKTHLPFECDGYVTDDGSYEFRYYCNQGESYFYDDYYGGWIDCADTFDYYGLEFNNALIKAYTYNNEPAPASDFEYSTSNGEVTINKYKGFSPRVIIPSTINGNSVTKINVSAFSNSKVSKVVLPSNLKRIEKHAFYNCNGLTEIVIPQSVSYIGPQAFSDCSNLSDVSFNVGSETLVIDNFAFLNCPLLKKVEFSSVNVQLNTKSFGYLYDYNSEKYTKSGITIRAFKNSQVYDYCAENSGYVTWEEIPLVPTSLKIIKEPDKTDYYYKETNDLILDGLEVEVKYNDGSVKIITDPSQLNISGFNRFTGTHTITVELGGCSDTFDITIDYLWWQWIINILLLGFIWY